MDIHDLINKNLDVAEKAFEQAEKSMAIAKDCLSSIKDLHTTDIDTTSEVK